MLIAQITDFHVQSGRRPVNDQFDTAAALDTCISHLNTLDPAPDVVLATGDLVNHGTDDDYGVLSEILGSLAAPLFVIPGNHDDRQALLRAFGRRSYLARCESWIQYAIGDWPVRLVALDTVVPGEVWGRLCAERLSWLDATLSEAGEAPTVVFLHHPPFATGLQHMDAMGLRDGAAGLAELVSRHRQVQAFFCGHVHRPVHTRWYGVPASIAPSTSHQVSLDLDPERLRGYVLEPPACHLHLWGSDTGLVTHSSYVGQFGGPFPFGGP